MTDTLCPPPENAVQMPEETGARRCPSCEGTASAATGIVQDPWRIVRCKTCGFVYTNPAPSYADLAGALSWDKSFDAHAKRKKRERPVVDYLDRKTRWRLHIFPRTSFAQHLHRQARPGPVVDVGCGSGGEFDAFEDGYTPFGVEIAPGLAEEARVRAEAKGGRVVTAPALEGLRAFDEAFFSAALLRSYLEHESEPLAVLREVSRTLRPDGVAIVKVPNWATLNRMVMGRHWCGVRLPDHVNYFTPRSLRDLAGKAGLTATFGIGGQFPTNDNMYAVMRKAG